jgi:uncharacterized phage protein (TIGR02220 family)
MRIIEVEIKNWSKHNPRSDAKSCTWFKMSNEFFNDPEFYGASLESRMVWIFILSAASKKMSPKIKINTQMIANSLGSRLESIDFAIEQLAFIGCLAISIAPVISITSGPNVKTMLLSSSVSNITEHNITEHNEDNITNIKPKFGPFEIINLLNSLCFTTFRNGQGHSRHINARIEEGFTLEDFTAVIKFKFAEWSNDPKFAHCIRPETLFGTKMDSYLQASKKPFKRKLAPSNENPTGDPYLEELNERKRKGEIA